MYDASLTYQQQAVATANPATLVLMMYDRVLVALTRIEQTDDRGVRHFELMRSQDILTELRATLDFERGGEIALNLEALYEYCVNELVQVTVTQDLGRLATVRSTVAGIREAWEQSCVRQNVPVAAA